MAAGFLLTVIAGLTGYLGAYLKNSSLHRRLYSAECAIADLEKKVLHEVKKRAGQETQAKRNLDLEILEAANKAPAAPAEPWYAPYIGKMK